MDDQPRDLYDAVNLAMGAIQYREGKDWVLFRVMPDGKVTSEDRLTERQVRHALRFTASMLGTSRYDSTTEAFVPDFDPTRAKKPRLGLSPRTRYLVLERDGFRCRYCGANAPETILHVDHIRSRKDGGTDALDNLVTACQPCNLGKGAKSSRGLGYVESVE